MELPSSGLENSEVFQLRASFSFSTVHSISLPVIPTQWDVWLQEAKEPPRICQTLSNGLEHRTSMDKAKRGMALPFFMRPADRPAVRFGLGTRGGRVRGASHLRFRRSLDLAAFMDGGIPHPAPHPSGWMRMSSVLSAFLKSFPRKS